MQETCSKRTSRKQIADYPSTWADKFYNTFFPADVIAKFNALPDYAMDKKERIDFRGFHNAPEDVWQTGDYKHDTWKLMQRDTTKLQYT